MTLCLPFSKCASSASSILFSPQTTAPSRTTRVKPARAESLRNMARTVDLFDEAQEQILQKIKQSPSLKPLVAQKLLDIVNGLSKEPSPSLDSLSPAERIKQGFLKFKTEKYLKEPALFNKLATGQSPKFMVIACSDSRVCPTTILGLEPGEAFVVRNVANMVPSWGENGLPSTSAALEYAVNHLKVENILVIGHSKCGGIKALMSQDDDDKRWSDYIQDWIKISHRARSFTKKTDGDIDSQCTECEKESVNVSLTNLVTFPWIKDAVLNGKLALHGGHYDFVDGSFEYWTLDIKKGQEDKF